MGVFCLTLECNFSELIPLGSTIFFPFFYQELQREWQEPRSKEGTGKKNVHQVNSKLLKPALGIGKSLQRKEILTHSLEFLIKALPSN